MKKLIMALALVCASLTVAAQALPDAPAVNVYAAGVTYGTQASPPIAGTALYAHQVSDSNTYAFTVFDAVVSGTKPLTVTSNVGIGVAQKFYTATVGTKTVDFYAPAATGVSWTGGNVGYQWNGGVLASVPVKLGPINRIFPTVRFEKSSVSGGTGYQVLAGVYFGITK